MDWERLPASSLLNAWVVWLRDRFHQREGGAQQWQAFWVQVTTPPPHAARAAALPAPTDADTEALYGG